MLTVYDRSGSASLDDGLLTPLGHAAMMLPTEAYVARFLVFAHCFGVMRRALLVAAVLSSGSVFVPPATVGGQASDGAEAVQQRASAPPVNISDAYRRRLLWDAHRHSDILATVSAFEAWRQRKSDDETDDDEWCRLNGLYRERLRQTELMLSELRRRSIALGLVSMHELSAVEDQTDSATSDLLLHVALAGALYPHFFRVCDQRAKLLSDLSGDARHADVTRAFHLKAIRSVVLDDGSSKAARRRQHRQHRESGPISLFDERHIVRELQHLVGAGVVPRIQYEYCAANPMSATRLYIEWPRLPNCDDPNGEDASILIRTLLLHARITAAARRSRDNALVAAASQRCDKASPLEEIADRLADDDDGDLNIGIYMSFLAPESADDERDRVRGAYGRAFRQLMSDVGEASKILRRDPPALVERVNPDWPQPPPLFVDALIKRGTRMMGDDDVSMTVLRVVIVAIERPECFWLHILPDAQTAYRFLELLIGSIADGLESYVESADAATSNEALLGRHFLVEATAVRDQSCDWSLWHVGDGCSHERVRVVARTSASEVLVEAIDIGGRHARLPLEALKCVQEPSERHLIDSWKSIWCVPRMALRVRLVRAHVLPDSAVRAQCRALIERACRYDAERIRSSWLCEFLAFTDGCFMVEMFSDSDSLVEPMDKQVWLHGRKGEVFF